MTWQQLIKGYILYFIQYNNKAVKFIVTGQYCSPKHTTGPKCLRLPASNVITSIDIKSSRATLSKTLTLLRITATLTTLLAGHTANCISLQI